MAFPLLCAPGMTKRRKWYLSFPGLALIMLCGSSCIGGVSCIEISFGKNGCLASDQIDTERQGEIRQWQPNGEALHETVTHTLRALR